MARARRAVGLPIAHRSLQTRVPEDLAYDPRPTSAPAGRPHHHREKIQLLTHDSLPLLIAYDLTHDTWLLLRVYN